MNIQVTSHLHWILNDELNEAWIIKSGTFNGEQVRYISANYNIFIIINLFDYNYNMEYIDFY